MGQERNIGRCRCDVVCQVRRGDREAAALACARRDDGWPSAAATAGGVDGDGPRQ